MRNENEAGRKQGRAHNKRYNLKLRIFIAFCHWQESYKQTQA